MDSSVNWRATLRHYSTTDTVHLKFKKRYKNFVFLFIASRERCHFKSLVTWRAIYCKHCKLSFSQFRELLENIYVNENNTFTKGNIEVNCIKTEKFPDSNIEAHLRNSQGKRNYAGCINMDAFPENLAFPRKEERLFRGNPNCALTWLGGQGLFWNWNCCGSA